MTLVTFLLLVVAGVGAGAVGYGAGVASLVSYPALLAAGLPPMLANMSNTVAGVGTVIGGALTARTELAPQRHRVRFFALAGALGGIGGAVLLLRTPTDAFETIVPVLVGGASVTVLLGPRLKALRGRALRWRTAPMFAAVAAVALYGGYFGAAAGVVLLAFFVATLEGTLPELNALKTVAMGCANFAASLVFVVWGSVDWAAAIAVGIGSIAGAAAAPPLVRRIPDLLFRLIVAGCGIALATILAIEAWR